MDGFFGKASGWSKATFILLFPALGLQCAGLGTVAWMKSRLADYSVVLRVGLWKLANCSGGYDAICIDSGLPSTYETALLHVTQALEVCSMVFMVLSLLVSAFYVTSPGVRVQKVAVWIMILCFVAMVLNVGGMVSWFQNLPTDHYVYWSLGLTLISAAFCILCAVLMIPDIRKYDYEGVERKLAEKRERKRRKKEGKDTAMLI